MTVEIPGKVHIVPFSIGNTIDLRKGSVPEPFLSLRVDKGIEPLLAKYFCDDKLVATSVEPLNHEHIRFNPSGLWTGKHYIRVEISLADGQTLDSPEYEFSVVGDAVKEFVAWNAKVAARMNEGMKACIAAAKSFPRDEAYRRIMSVESKLHYSISTLEPPKSLSMSHKRLLAKALEIASEGYRAATRGHRVYASVHSDEGGGGGGGGGGGLQSGVQHLSSSRKRFAEVLEIINHVGTELGLIAELGYVTDAAQVHGRDVPVIRDRR